MSVDIQAIVPGEKTLVPVWACCVRLVPYRSGSNPRLGPSTFINLSLLLLSHPTLHLIFDSFFFLSPSAFLLSLQLFSFPGKKHPKKHLSTLQIVPISSAPLRKNVVFWPRPKFIAFLDCLSSSLRIPELAFASVIRTALACLVATFSVLTSKSSIFGSRVNYSLFLFGWDLQSISPGHFILSSWPCFARGFIFSKYPLNCFFSFFFHFRGVCVCQQITSTSASSRPLPRVRDFQNLASPCTAWFFYHLPYLLLATRSLYISSPVIGTCCCLLSHPLDLTDQFLDTETPILASTLSFSVVEFRSRRLIA